MTKKTTALTFRHITSKALERAKLTTDDDWMTTGIVDGHERRCFFGNDG